VPGGAARALRLEFDVALHIRTLSSCAEGNPLPRLPLPRLNTTSWRPPPSSAPSCRPKTGPASPSLLAYLHRVKASGRARGCCHRAGAHRAAGHPQSSRRPQGSRQRRGSSHATTVAPLCWCFPQEEPQLLPEKEAEEPEQHGQEHARAAAAATARTSRTTTRTARAAEAGESALVFPRGSPQKQLLHQFLTMR